MTRSATQYSPATVKRARTICAAVDAQQKQRAIKDANAWRKRPASKSQIARIHRAEKALGWDLTPTFSATIRTAGDASDYFQALKKEF